MSLRTSSRLFPQNEQRRCRSIFSCLAMGPPVLLFSGAVFSALPDRHGFQVLGRARNNLVDQAVSLGFFARHEIVALGVSRDLFQWLPRMFGHDLVQPLADLKNFFGMNVDLRGLALKSTHWLMNHDSCVRQGVTF